MKNNNPFLTTGYISPGYFCDREKESSEILEAIKNGRHLTIISVRRIGKTGLIKHVLYHLEKDKSIDTVYLDILPTNDLSSFIKTLGIAVVQQLESNPSKIFNKIAQGLSRLKPTLSYDLLTGHPKIEFGLAPGQQEEFDMSLQQVFQYLEKKNKRVVIAIDEFQQILNYPEKNVESLLRKHIQQATNLSFIYSGSHKHMLMTIFNNYGNPFYNSTQTKYLEKIEENKYLEFIQNHFKQAGKTLSSEQVRHVLNWTRCHTYFTQFVCNRLYSLDYKRYSFSIIESLLTSILKENELIYFNYKKLLTSYQFSLLAAIAKENGVRKPTSGTFIFNHRLNSPSSVQTALKTLIDKEMLYQKDKEYHVTDVFFARWLEKFF